MPNRLRFSSLLTAASLLSGCIQPTINPITTPPASETTAGAVTDSAEWVALAPGLERRTLQPGGNYTLTQFLVVRIDPAYFTFRAHYRPGEPLTISGWRDALAGAAVIVNANFFDAQGQALGLLVSDGQVFGTAYTDRGGFFTVQDGQVRVRSTLLEPYRGEALEQAVQAFPMLVSGGAAAYTTPRPDRASRRTAIGQDQAGRVLIVVSSSLIGMRLTEFSTFLAASDLALVEAFNLDGGGSTMLHIDSGEALQVPSFDAVPAVLAVYPR
ncbi:MAG: phosphodiester glycosidase family protein [bacterium]|nr:phosphodiester glycosidase family protein [bacterium]